ncbi:MAG: hypothetical protein AVDCRST_MAG48-1207, partial [uncultured Friedmanniella sp.]
QPQLSSGPFPATLHLSVSAATVPRLPEFLTALDEAVAASVAAGPTTVDPGLAAVLAGLDAASLEDAGFDQLLAMAGLADGSGTPALPARMAPVNAVLDAAPPALREALLVGYLDRVSRPVRAADAARSSGS